MAGHNSYLWLSNFSSSYSFSSSFFLSVFFSFFRLFFFYLFFLLLLDGSEALQGDSEVLAGQHTVRASGDKRRSGHLGLKNTTFQGKQSFTIPVPNLELY